MEITSLARQTDLIFSEFGGEVLHRDAYVVVRTPGNPGYHWGNYVIFAAPPTEGDLERWQGIYRHEFQDYGRIGHMTFTWNPAGHSGAIQPFISAGFKYERAKVLTADQVREPKKRNSDVRVRPVRASHEWEEVIQLQIRCKGESFAREGYEIFKRRQFANYRKMSDAGHGNWFGAFLGEQLVGDLGIFRKNGIARYQAVETHPSHRRKGICGTLVYETAQLLFREFGIETLVMEADADYHAAAIYESVGFQVTEVNESLSWWEN